MPEGLKTDASAQNPGVNAEELHRRESDGQPTRREPAEETLVADSEEQHEPRPA